MKDPLSGWLPGRNWLHTIPDDQTARILLISLCGMGWNLLYALFHFSLAVLHGSLWYWTMAVYYLVLGLMKMAVVLLSREGNRRKRRLVMCINAVALMFLPIVIFMAGSF